MAIPNRQSLIFASPEALLLKMENRTENLEKSMKNSSAFTAPTTAGAADSAELPAPAIAPGLTCKGGNSSGDAHGNHGVSDGFTLVSCE